MPPEPRYPTKKIIIIGIIILVIGAIIGFLLLRNSGNQDTITDPGKNLFPFGPSTPTTPSETPVEVPGTDGAVEDPITSANAERLRQITQYPVTGLYVWTANKIIREPKLDEVTKETVFVPSIVPTTMVRWNVKQTGVLMDAEITKPTILIEQATKTVIPVAEEMHFGGSGTNPIFRTFSASDNVISTLVGHIKARAPLDYCTQPFTINLKQGSKGPAVVEFQKYINHKLGLNIATDGSLGPKTFALVKNIQKALGIPENSTFDDVTRNGINSDCALVVQAYQDEQKEPLDINGSFLPDNILRVAVSPDTSKLFFLQRSSGTTQGITADADGKNQRRIWTSPLTEWMPQWVNNTTIALTTLASREADGYLYFLNPSTGATKKVLGPARGLTTLASPDAKTILVGSSTDQGIELGLFTTTTGTYRRLDLATLPTKCVWQNNAVFFCGVPRTISANYYPDAWYQGLISFTDTLWKIDLEKSTTEVVLAPVQSFDMTYLTLSPDGSYIFFIPRAEETLWSYRLSE
jgi:hypothetical protein